MQGNKKLLYEPYKDVRREKSDEVDEAVRVFQRFPNKKYKFHPRECGFPHVNAPKSYHEPLLQSVKNAII